MVNRYTCPVCGYYMEVPPSDYNICSSCGTEFDPFVASFEALREAWIATGPAWWSQYNPRPDNWNPREQLKRLALNGTDAQALPAHFVSYYLNGNNSTMPPMMHKAPGKPRRAIVAAGGNSNAAYSEIFGLLQAART